jgi:hypothetical protein
MAAAFATPFGLAASSALAGMAAALLLFPAKASEHGAR